MEVQNDLAAVGFLFGRRVAWLQPASLLFETFGEAGEAAMEKWADNYLLKMMVVHGGMNDPDPDFTALGPDEATRALEKWFQSKLKPLDQSFSLFGGMPFYKAPSQQELKIRFLHFNLI